jgi:hypothetical protein
MRGHAVAAAGQFFQMPQPIQFDNQAMRETALRDNEPNSLPRQTSPQVGVDVSITDEWQRYGPSNRD